MAGTNASEQFASIYREHVWSVYGFIGYRVRSRETAEDLTQQTFERAFAAWRRFDPERANPRTWLLSIARNVVIDTYRKESRAELVPIDEMEGDPTQAHVAGRDEPDLGLDPDLERALGKLSDRDREVIALRFGGDMTGPQIAAELGITLANAQQILSRSLRKLAAEVEPPVPALADGRS